MTSKLKCVKGVTLLEMLACITIMGILAMTMAGLFTSANRTIARLNKAVQAASLISTAQPCVVLVATGKSGQYKVVGACNK